MQTQKTSTRALRIAVALGFIAAGAAPLAGAQADLHPLDAARSALESLGLVDLPLLAAAPIGCDAEPEQCQDLCNSTGACIDPCSADRAIGLAASCFPCRSVRTSGRETLWTHYSQAGGGSNGFRLPSVAGTGLGAWRTISGASFIWKDGPIGSSQAQTRVPVMFEAPAIKGCLPVPTVARLQVNADNSFIAVWNGQIVASCGNYFFQSSPHTNCFNTWGANAGLSVATLTVQPNQANHLVLYVWNHGGPAMAQYRIDY